ncbi:MAG TPA: STAS/SEC14 domain-containing protein [Polyangiaceae bacterium]|nr:STAS/SEC14 domain-containing protein [Polyangiaceae bacterium]
MLEKLNDAAAAGIVWVNATGKVSREDYRQVVEPLFEEARREGRRIRFLYQLGPSFEGFTAGAAWEDAKVGLQFLRVFEACAVVTDLAWIRDATSLARFMLPCPVRVFENQNTVKAIEWLRSQPAGAAVTQRLHPDSGVMVVEVTRPLRAGDFDALSFTADAWIEAHGKLHGLVIHARAFPGWENLGSLVEHVRFVRDHQRKVERVALAVESKLAELAPHVAKHFVSAEVKRFGYDELEAAVAWASSAPAQVEPARGR